MPEWTPDRPVDLDLAASLVRAAAPHLAGLPVRSLGIGWDNTVVLVGTDWVFRFIHRAVALDGARRELAVLHALACQDPPLPVPLPRPLVTGTGPPGPDGVGWPFWGAPFLRGVELARAPRASADVAAALGRLLAALHAPPLAALGAGLALPHDPLGRADPQVVVPRARARLARLRTAGAATAQEQRVEAILASAEHLGPGTGEPVLVHGDLHLRHVLVDGAAISDVIDWGDTALADPSVDLMIGWAAFDGAARCAFFEAYGPVPSDRELRSRALAIAVHAALAEQAAADGDETLLAAAIGAITRAAG